MNNPKERPRPALMSRNRGKINQSYRSFHHVLMFRNPGIAAPTWKQAARCFSGEGGGE